MVARSMTYYSWWRHQMETFSALLAICAMNSPVTGEFLAQRPVTRSFDVFFDLRQNKGLSKQSWGLWFGTPSRPLWRHCNDYYSRWVMELPIVPPTKVPRRSLDFRPRSGLPRASHRWERHLAHAARPPSSCESSSTPSIRTQTPPGRSSRMNWLGRAVTGNGLVSNRKMRT